MNSKIGNNIKKLRETNNMSQEELAESLHCTRQTISNYERGVSEPDIETIKKMTSVFNCDVKEIIETNLKKDNKLIIQSLIKTIIILIFCILVYLISLGLFPYYFNNALYLCRIVLIPFSMYCIGLFVGDLLCFFNHEIRNRKIKKYIRIGIIVFIVVDILLLLPVLGENIYVLLSKLFIEGDLSFSFVGNNPYYLITYAFVIFNIKYSWVFIILGLTMRMTSMKNISDDVKISQKVNENIL